MEVIFGWFIGGKEKNRDISMVGFGTETRSKRSKKGRYKAVNRRFENKTGRNFDFQIINSRNDCRKGQNKGHCRSICT